MAKIAPTTLDDLKSVLEEIRWHLAEINFGPHPQPVAPVVNVSPPEVHIPQPEWPPDLLSAIGAIPDSIGRIRFPEGGGPPIDLPPLLEALGRIEKLLSQQRQSEGRTLGLVPKQPATAADGSQTVTVQNAVPVTMMGRLMNRQPLAGYQLWLDTANTSFLYVLEAPVGSGASAAGFQGIRSTLDALGNLLGEVQQNTGPTLTFANRTTDSNWS